MSTEWKGGGGEEEGEGRGGRERGRDNPGERDTGRERGYCIKRGIYTAGISSIIDNSVPPFIPPTDCIYIHISTRDLWHQSVSKSVRERSQHGTWGINDKLSDYLLLITFWRRAGRPSAGTQGSQRTIKNKSWTTKFSESENLKVPTVSLKLMSIIKSGTGIAEPAFSE